MNVFLKTVVILFLVTVPTLGWACLCAPPSQEDALDGADLVFVGRAIEEVEYPFEFVWGNRVEEITGSPMLFEVLEDVKNSSGVYVLIHNNPDRASCGYPFEVGVTYKVYASKIPVGGDLPFGPPGEYGTTSCSGTLKITSESEE